VSAGSCEKKPWGSPIIAEQINNQALFSSALVVNPRLFLKMQYHYDLRRMAQVSIASYPLRPRRSFTIFLIKSIGMGLSSGKWMVPLDVEKPFSSSLNASITAAVGNRLQWLANAAYQTKTFLC
jgi:hypothetical protein